MGIGSKLSALLSERNMNVSELAKRTGIAPSTIYSIIQRNNKKVDIDVLLNIANVLGVKAEYFSDNYSEQQTSTFAAHFDGNDYTESELEEIRQFAEFVKSRKNNQG